MRCGSRLSFIDIRASNTLLDSELNSRLGNFGLARIYDHHGDNPQTIHVVGTLCHAPEHARIGKATTSADMFALGAILLKVACRKRPIDPQFSADEPIRIDWVSECWKRGNPKGHGPKIEHWLVLTLGLLCSHLVPAARPSIRQVM